MRRLLLRLAGPSSLHRRCAAILIIVPIRLMLLVCVFDLIALHFGLYANEQLVQQRHGGSERRRQ